MSRKTKQQAIETERAYLRDVLRGAVRQWIVFAANQPWSELRSRAQILYAAVAAMGDEPDYTNPDVLNLTAQAIALAAFSPGGVWYLDMHFQVKHPDMS